MCSVYYCTKRPLENLLDRGTIDINNPSPSLILSSPSTWFFDIDKFRGFVRIDSGISRLKTSVVLFSVHPESPKEGDFYPPSCIKRNSIQSMSVE